MGLLKDILEKILPKKRVPIKVRIEYLEGIQRDNYLFSLLDDIEKEKKRLDVVASDKV